MFDGFDDGIVNSSFIVFEFPFIINKAMSQNQISRPVKNVNNQSIVSITVTAGAAGTCDILAQVTPIYYTTEERRFRTDRG